jgi:hypothetical protein
MSLQNYKDKLSRDLEIVNRQITSTENKLSELEALRSSLIADLEVLSGVAE